MTNVRAEKVATVTRTDGSTEEFDVTQETSYGYGRSVTRISLDEVALSNGDSISMTMTTDTPQRQLDISDFVIAAERLKSGDQMAPPKEFRMHPDDYESLKRQADQHMPYPSTGENRFDGLDIIIDSTAPRLPRR
jgi:hypothetical protein